jgi:hypothetical protein
MTTTSHYRRKVRKLAIAKQVARAAMIAKNLSCPVTPKGFAPNGLATCRQPWGDHGVRIGQNVRGETGNSPALGIGRSVHQKSAKGAAYVRNLQSRKDGKQSD